MDTSPRVDAAGTRQLSDLAIELSVAVHKHSMYPLGHPALTRVADGVWQRTAALFTEREQIAIGVARRQLIIEGVATDETHPVLRRLAETLHAHQLGAVSLLRGVQVQELREALQALAVEPERGGAIGLAAPDARPSWPHVRLHPLTFDNLAIVAPVDGASTAGSGHSHSAELWLGLAQAALAGDGPRESLPTPELADPEVLARAIDARTGAQAYDQVIAGYLMQIGQALRGASGAEVDALRNRTSGLIAALQPATLQRLVRTSRTESGPHSFVGDAVQGLRVDAVLQVLKATADVTGETISHGLIRMLTKLAAHAEGTSDKVRSAAEEALRAQVSRLLADWKLADPNPESYGRLLQQLATSVQVDEAAAEADAVEIDPALRLVQMGLELGDLGILGSKAATRQMASGGMVAMVSLLESPPPAAGAALDSLRGRLTSAGALTQLLAEEPVNFAALDALLPSMASDDYGPLFDALADSGSRLTRRRLLDRLAQSPHDLAPQIVARLGDPRWHVVRNLLFLLELTGAKPEGFTPVPYLMHDDWRVRVEAVKLALARPQDRTTALTSALSDAQPRIVGMALAELRPHCHPSFVPRVAALAGNAALPDDTRVLALRALNDVTHPAVLAMLLSVLDGGRTLLGRAKLAAGSPVTVPAVSLLSRRYASEPAARPYLKLARASSHPGLRAAAHEGAP